MDVFASVRPGFLFAVNRVFGEHARLIERAQRMIPICQIANSSPIAVNYPVHNRFLVTES